MILEEETYEAFEYLSSELSPQSNKLIIAACELCGKFRIAPKSHYHTFCQSCSLLLGEMQKGKKHPLFGKHSWNFGKSSSEETKVKQRAAHKGHIVTDEAKAKMSAAHKGNKNGLGYKHTNKEKALMSAAKKGENNHNYGNRGEESTNYKGGKKVAIARRNAKRKRDLGYDLLMPLEEGEVGHHITNEDIIGIPKEVHVRFSGLKRQKHRTFILQWLKANDKKKYKLVLCTLAKQSLKGDK